VSMLMKIVQGNFLPLHQVNPNVPLPVRKLVEKMLQTDTQKRYANVDELLESLREVEKAIALSESKTAGKETVSRIEPEPVGVRQPVEQHFQEQKKRGNLWPAVTVALIIVLLLSGAFAAKVFYFDKRSSPGESSERPKSQDITSGSNESSSSLSHKNGSIETTTDPVERSDPSEAGDQTGVQGMEADSSTQRGVSVVKPTTTSSTTSTTSKRSIVKKPVPPAKSLIVTTLGNGDNEDLITSYVQSVFSRANFTIMDGPSIGSRNLSDIARYHLVVTVKPLGTTTLNYYGSSSEQYTVGLTMKAVATRSGKIIAGPLTAAVKYTTLNAEENLKKAAVRLASRLQKALEN